MEQLTVHVLTTRWSHRSGDDGDFVLGVFFKKEDAEAAMAEYQESYLKDMGVIRPDGSLDLSAINEVDGEDASGKTLEDLLGATCYNIDSDGTWCSWFISEREVQ